MSGLASAKFDLQDGFTYNYFASIIQALIARHRCRLLHLHVDLDARHGRDEGPWHAGRSGQGWQTLTQEQAIRRWIALGAPFSLAQAFNPLPLLGLLIGLAAFGWVIYLLYTTWQSPTKQGFHDIFANTMVVKATRTAG